MKKMKPLLYILFMAICAKSYAQEITSVKSFYDKSHKVGDTIQAGEKPINYFNILELSQGKHLIPSKQKLDYNKMRIVNFTTSDKLEKTNSIDTLAIVHNLADKNRVFYVDIFKASKSKDIIEKIAQRLYPDAPLITGDVILAPCLKTNELAISDWSLQYYIKAKDKEFGEKCQNDEFEFYTVKELYTDSLENEIENIDFDELYYFDHAIGFDKYDFTKKAFPMNFYQINSYNMIKLHDFQLNIQNLDSFNYYYVKPELAKHINKLRQGSESYLGSLVYARVYFRFVDKKVEFKKEKYGFFDPESAYRQSVVAIELQGMELYTDSHCKYNFLGSFTVD